MTTIEFLLTTIWISPVFVLSFHIKRDSVSAGLPVYTSIYVASGQQPKAAFAKKWRVPKTSAEGSKPLRIEDILWMVQKS